MNSPQKPSVFASLHLGQPLFFTKKKHIGLQQRYQLTWSFRTPNRIRWSYFGGGSKNGHQKRANSCAQNQSLSCWSKESWRESTASIQCSWNEKRRLDKLESENDQSQKTEKPWMYDVTTEKNKLPIWMDGRQFGDVPWQFVHHLKRMAGLMAGSR